MKKLFLILMAGFALIMAHDSNRVYAGDHDGDDGGIPLSKLAGKYAITYQIGSFLTQCFKPDFSAPESCSTPGAVGIPIYPATTGQMTQDSDGDACQKSIGAFAAAGQPTPATILVFFSVVKVTDYDPATGSGDNSVADYAGGKCIGSKFDKTGATLTNTGTGHFVASDDGKRVDFNNTGFKDALGNDIDGVIISGAYLKQGK